MANPNLFPLPTTFDLYYGRGMLRCNTKSTLVTPATLVISPDLIRYSWSRFPSLVSLDFLLIVFSFVQTLLIRECCSCCSPNRFSYTLFLDLTPAQNRNLVMFCLQSSFSFMPHNSLIIFPFHRYIHSQEYLYECIMYD